MRLTERRRRVLALGVGALAALLLFPVLLSLSPASASTLSDCLAQQHVCVTGDGRSLISQSQEADLEQQMAAIPSTWWSPRPARPATTAR